MFLYSGWKSSAKMKQTSEDETSENRTGIPYVRTKKILTPCCATFAGAARREGGAAETCLSPGNSGCPLPRGVCQHPGPTLGTPAAPLPPQVVSKTAPSPGWMGHLPDKGY